ncbi:hypothetical protein ACFVFQ_36190 [Streptomyces sp. NPDC057743]|uniref:hypothetical protein n=1 Tax=Streptomyces sp. NPDC057743 TaxID=3346236 RepID=UPI0036863A84
MLLEGPVHFACGDSIPTDSGSLVLQCPFSNARRLAVANTGGDMADPRAILDQARQGSIPENWRVFTKKRGKISGFFHGTSQDPDPLLVITPDGAIEYVSESKSLAIVNFCDVAKITLRVTASSFSDSTTVNLSVWLDLDYRDGRKGKWQAVSFKNDFQAIQDFIEAYATHKALRGG